MYSFGFEIDGKKYVKYQIFLLRIGDVKLLKHVLLFSVVLTCKSCFGTLV